MRTCKYRNCDNKFTGAPGQLYCDNLCKSREAEYRQERKKTTKTVQCKYVHCGADIDIVGQESRKYCNNSCRDKAQYLRTHKAAKKPALNIPLEFLERGLITYGSGQIGCVGSQI